MNLLTAIRIAPLVTLLAGCAWHPPPEPPRMTHIYGEVRQLPDDGDGLGWLAVRAGWAMDPIGREGLARVAAALLEQQGAEMISFGAERVIYSVDPAGAERLAAWLAAPQISGEALQRAVASVQAAGRSMKCAQIADAALDQLMLGGHPYGGPGWGRGSVLPTITPDEARAFLMGRYVKDGIALEGMEGWLWDGLPVTLSRAPIPAPLPPPPEALPEGQQAQLWVVTAPAGGCEGLASYAEPPLGDWEPIRLAWRKESGRTPDLRLQRPVRLVGDGEQIQRRITEGFDAGALQEAADISGTLTFRLERLLLASPVAAPPGPVVPLSGEEAARLNGLLRQWLDSGPRLRVVVSTDAALWTGADGRPKPGVSGIVAASEMFE